jgi:hypothetical protein
LPQRESATADAPSTRFETPGPLVVGERRLTRVPLTEPGEGSSALALRDDTIEFLTAGWYEVLLEVHWDEQETEGTRFAHTKIPGQQPLHSEAIAAAVLAQISEGRQLLRGNGLFGPGGPSSIALEVWHDSDYAIAVRSASLTVRELSVPFPPAPPAFGDHPSRGCETPEEVRPVPKGKEGPSIKKPDTYEALRDKGMSKERAAKISNAQANKQSKGKAKKKS